MQTVLAPEAHSFLAAVEHLPDPAKAPRGELYFGAESLTDALWAELLPLLEAHWREIAHYPDIPLEVDRASYDRAQAAGMTRVFTVRDHVERLQGYALFFVRPNMHYRSSVQAVQDVVYLAPQHRGGPGARFIARCDKELAAEGIQVVYHHVKQAHNFGPMLERQGYTLVDLIYAKRLDVRAPC